METATLIPASFELASFYYNRSVCSKAYFLTPEARTSTKHFSPKHQINMNQKNGELHLSTNYEY